MYQKSATEDFRQIVTVSLQRDGRNKYWDFNCMYCGTKVCELDGTLVYISDIWNDTKSAPVLIRCVGNNRKWCKYWYGFLLSG